MRLKEWTSCIERLSIVNFRLHFVKPPGFLRVYFFSQECDIIAMYVNLKKKSLNVKFMHDDLKCSENDFFVKFKHFLRNLKSFFFNENHKFEIVCDKYVFWDNSFKNRMKSTSHTNINYASIYNYWVNLLMILIFYFYYVLIDNVFPYSWSVIINNYILFNWGQNSPRFLYHRLLFLSTKVKVLQRNGFLRLFPSPITYALVIYKSTREWNWKHF